MAGVTRDAREEQTRASQLQLGQNREKGYSMIVNVSRGFVVTVCQRKL